MKNSKLLKYIIASAVVIALIASGTLAVLAVNNQADVIFQYNGENSTFRFKDSVIDQDINDSTYNVSVFRIENAMPGDEPYERTLKVGVSGINGKNVTVNMWMRIENKEGDWSNLAQFLTVQREGSAITDKVLTETGSDNDNRIFLGQFTSDAAKQIDIKFEMPITAGNEVMNKSARIDWVFIADYTVNTPPPEPGTDVTPQLERGDHFAYIIGAPDGLVRPEASITRAEVATILFRCFTDESRAYYWSTENPFSDVEKSDWYNNAISTLTKAGVIKGNPDGTFHPQSPITRAEYATMLSRYYAIENSDGVSFSDIEGHWAEEAIISGAVHGYINGDPDGRFRPDEPITRAEAMALTNRVLGRKPVNNHLLDDMIKWPDNADTNKWYYADVQEATNSHNHEMYEDHEEWTKLVPHKDWVALEKEWSVANDENKQTLISKPF